VVPLLADEHIPPALVEGARARQPALNIIYVQDATLGGTLDPDLLEWAAANNRAVVTFDRNTLVAAAFSRINAGRPMTGVIVIDDQMPIARAIDELLIVAECSLSNELHGRVVFIPLR
jgi:Domain of unknown function (DUF5615)